MGEVDDTGPLILGVTWWLSCLSGVFLAVRLYIKISRRYPLWWDDWILVMAWALFLGYSVALQLVRNMGLGRHIYDIDLTLLPSMGLHMSVVSMLGALSAGFSKVSFGVTLLRLTSGWAYRLVWFAILTIIAATIPMAIFVWVQCTPVAALWNPQVVGHCWSRTLADGLQIGGMVWCSTMDFVLAMVPWHIIWHTPLQRKEKIGVGLAMSVGILAGICGLLKAAYLYETRGADVFHDGVDIALWMAGEMGTAIIAASIPILRVIFVKRIASSRAHYRVNSDEVLRPEANTAPSEKGPVVTDTAMQPPSASSSVNN